MSGAEYGTRPIRVLVLTAPVAEGHLAAARALADDIRLVNERAEVTVCDVLPAVRRPIRWLLHDAYRWQLRAAPWLFASLFGALRRNGILRWLSRSTLSLAGSKRLLRLERAHRPDVIVSTWPPATMALGSLRLRGKIRVPVCATITDFAGLELWADKGVDLHLVMHQSLVPVIERVAGRGSACVVSPLVSSRFRPPASAEDARRRLGVPLDETLIVVSGGGWAVGDLEGAVRAALEIDAHVICLAGRDAAARVRLHEIFEHEPRVTVLGFTDRMSELLSAANVLVHSTGGVTCLEALVCGCAIVAYGAPPGHAPLSARTMSALGLAAFVGSRDELGTALMSALRTPAVVLGRGTDSASVVLAAAPRVAARLRARVARGVSAACALTLALFSLLASDATYPIVAEAHAVPERTSILPSRHSVALVVRGDRAALLRFASFAREDRLRASVIATDPLAAHELSALRADGVEPLPELRARGVASWFGADGQLTSQLTSYRLRRPFYYLSPHEGFTIVDYLLGRRLGGVPVEAKEDVLASNARLADVGPGTVLVATLDSRPGHDQGHLAQAIQSLERDGLEISSVQRLAAAAHV